MRKHPHITEPLCTVKIDDIRKEAIKCIEIINKPKDAEQREIAALRLKELTNNILMERLPDEVKEPGITDAKEEAMKWISILQSMNLPKENTSLTRFKVQRHIKGLMNQSEDQRR
jgi:hypothetical protein